MKRFQLKSIANKMNKDIDLYNFRKQQNLVVNLNKKEKKKFLNSLSMEMVVTRFGKLVNFTFRTRE